ncbi:placenta-expressed transcript 1 protein-like [Chelydra serpentina]|uniref:Placenta-expressed transcript 1 protein n=1 Tax=Chelydra serpentina TaxID=8475 RepID=A0A8T1SCE3_CHESE|nr:placenta-expressed transcript 1 protein-like [Chelydra serpentina]
MAALTTTLQLLFLGALISPVYLQDDCQSIQTATLGSYNLSVTPADYKANTNYSVTISGATNSSSVILQALNTQNSSVGQWEDPVVNCNNTSVGKQNITTTATVQWTSPANETAPVEISVFVTFRWLYPVPEEIPEYSIYSPTCIDNKDTRHHQNHQFRVHSAGQSFLLAAIHLLSVFVTGKLFC